MNDSTTKFRYAESVNSMTTESKPNSRPSTRASTKVENTPATSSDLGRSEEVNDVPEAIIVQVPFSPADSQKLLRKVDRRIVPYFFIVYMMAFLDRTNITAAHKVGLDAQLHLHGENYNLAVGLFYIFCFLAGVPSNITIKNVSPKIWLMSITLAFGIVMMLQGFVRDYSCLLVCRSLLGFTQGGFYPGVAWYFTTWYPRYEIGYRIALLFSAAPMAGAVGGFLARGISLMDGIGDFRAWSWIFIIEGLATIVVALFSFTIVNNIASAKFLTEGEKLELRYRRRTDAGADFPIQFNWKCVGQAFRDFKIYANMLQTIGIYAALYSISIFLPSIFTKLGYTTTKSQLLAIPVYMWAAILMIIGSLFSDRYRQRGVFMLGFELFALIGLLMLRLSTDPAVQFAGTFIVAGGIYPLVPLIGAWNSNNLAGSTKRAIGIAMQIGFGNLGGIVATYIYQPGLKQGHTILIALLLLSTIITAFMTWWFRQENSRRTKVLALDQYTPEMLRDEEVKNGDRAITFVYTI